MKKIVEICCASYEDAVIAEKAGADGIELNSSLFLGGLTPSLGTIRKIREKLNIPIIAMVRPRAGGFNYNDYEYEVMLEDIEIFLEEDIEGIVFGILKEDKSLDIERNKKIVELIHGKGKLAVFHRAFDQLEDPIRGIEELIDMGIDRVLTSGQKPNAREGLELLEILERKYGDRIEVLVGSGVNSENVNDIYNKTKIKNYHSSCKTWRKDNTTIGNISYSYGEKENKEKYEVTDFRLAKDLVESVRKI